MRGDKGHAHEDVAGRKLGDKPSGQCAIAAHVDGDEIGGRRQGREAVLAGYLADFGTRGFD
jgi:hypothetical protein